MKQKIYKKFVDQSRYDSGQFVFRGSINEVINSLIAIRDSIPSEFHENTTAEISSEPDYDGHYANIEISGWRFETDEEEKSREDLEKEERKKKRAAQAAVRKNKEEKERAEFARLSAKYGPKASNGK